MSEAGGKSRQSWLVRAYPTRWRKRYGDELSALLEDDDHRGLARVGRDADVLVAGVHEHLSGAGLMGRRLAPEERARANALLVLAAWACFVPAGIALQKSAEHWDEVVSWSGRQVPSAAFAVVQVGAVVGAMAVVVGGVLCGARLWRWMRSGAWRPFRRLFMVTAAVDLAAGALTTGVIVWARTSSTASPVTAAGHRPYVLLGIWVALVLGALATTTVAVVVVARQLEPGGALLRAEVGLSVAAALAMVAMCAAAALWWATVPGASRSLVERGVSTGSASDFYPPLVVVLVAMALAAATALLGGLRALSALGESPAAA